MSSARSGCSGCRAAWRRTSTRPAGSMTTSGSQAAAMASAAGPGPGVRSTGCPARGRRGTRRGFRGRWRPGPGRAAARPRAGSPCRQRGRPAPPGSGFAAPRPGSRGRRGPRRRRGGRPASRRPRWSTSGRSGRGALVETRSKGYLTSSPRRVIPPTARGRVRGQPSVSNGRSSRRSRSASSSRSCAARSASSARSWLEQVGERVVDHRHTCGGEPDEDAPTVPGVGVPLHEPARREPVDAVGHGAARDERLGDELTGAQLVGVSGATQCGRGRRTPSRPGHGRRRRCHGPGRGGARAERRGTTPRGARRPGRVAHAATRRRYGRHRQRARADSTARQVS